MRTSIWLFLAVMLLLGGCERTLEHASRNEGVDPAAASLKELSRRHLSYWEDMSTKNFADAFEMPHQRFLHSKAWYETFNSANKSDYTVKQTGIELKNPSMAYVDTTITMENGTYSYRDRWYLINGSWYHWMRTSLLPGHAYDD